MENSAGIAGLGGPAASDLAAERAGSFDPEKAAAFRDALEKAAAKSSGSANQAQGAAGSREAGTSARAPAQAWSDAKTEAESKAPAQAESQAQTQAKSETQDEPADQTDKALLDACRQFESFFIYQMFKSMRETVPQNSWGSDSNGVQIFQGMLDEEYSKSMSAAGGFGLSKILYEQMKPLGKTVNRS